MMERFPVSCSPLDFFLSWILTYHLAAFTVFLSPRVSTGEQQEWVETLQTATPAPVCGSQKPSDSLPHLPSANKLGLLELRGYKGRVLVSLAGSKVRLCKTEQVLYHRRDFLSAG